MKKFIENFDSEYENLLARLYRLENPEIINTSSQSNHLIGPLDEEELVLQARLDALMLEHDTNDELNFRIDRLQRFDNYYSEPISVNPQELSTRLANLKDSKQIPQRSEDEHEEPVPTSSNPADISPGANQSTNLFSIYKSAVSNINSETASPLKSFKVNSKLIQLR